MSQRLALQRCWNHSEREAVARCPECTRFYCRECVVEHADRVICSNCLARIHAGAAKPRKRIRFAPLARVAAALFGIIVGWMIFFTAGRMLLAVPDQFHAETLWERSWRDDFEEGRKE